jgi:dsRNA-specific ribonuclease
MYHLTPTYTMVSLENGMYTMAVVNHLGKQLGVGTSSTKKQAEQIAAKESIKYLQP